MLRNTPAKALTMENKEKRMIEWQSGEMHQKRFAPKMLFELDGHQRAFSLEDKGTFCGFT